MYPAVKKFQIKNQGDKGGGIIPEEDEAGVI